ncbi:MAG: protein kinase [Polyangiaceae bacterium]|nr:protein kinase [Polyangiaceae bacterium]
MTGPAALGGLIGVRIGGRFELVAELEPANGAARYEALDVDGSRCLVALFADGQLEERLRASGSAVLDFGIDESVHCGYVVEPLSKASRPSGDESRLGTTIGGQYLLVALLGQGGMGTVYEAQTTRGERVAVKIVRADSTRPEDKRRFLREARAAMQLRSEHVVNVHASGVDDATSLPFIAMELLRGEDLAHVVAREGALHPSVAVRIAVDACRGLAAAHTAGLVHRDVKPSNIFLHREGDAVVVKVCDFGIVKDLVLTQSETLLTRTGALIGSPGYMSPEQAHDSSVVDQRTDVWSLGATLYEALTGTAPWASCKTIGEVLLTLHTRDVSAVQDSAPWIEDRLAKVVHRALARDPASRYANAAEFLEALEGFASPVPLRVEDIKPIAPELRGASVARINGAALGLTSTALDSAVRPTPIQRKSRRWLAGALALLALGGVALWRIRGAPGPNPSLHSTSAVPRCTQESCTSAAGGKVSRCSADATCVELENDACTIIADEATKADERTVWIGAMFPTRDQDPYMAELGRASRRAMELARRDFMSVSGGLPPKRNGQTARPIGIIACDDAADAPAAARHLVRAGVSAVVGFRSSKDVISLATHEFIPNDVLVVPALNSSALISTIPYPEGSVRLVYRTAIPTGDAMRALSAFIEGHVEPQMSARPGERSLLLLRAHDAVGLALSESALNSLRFNGRSIPENGRLFRELSYDDADGSASLERAVTTTLEQTPDIVVFHAVTDQIIDGFIGPLEARWPQDRPRPVYVVPGTLDGAPLGRAITRRPDLSARLFGLTPLSTTPANLRFTNSYNAAFGEQLAPADAPGAPYDSFYLIAYAAHAAETEAPRGSDLARAITRLRAPGTPIEVGPTSILRAFGELERGKSIDLQGTYSRMDFDPTTGESPADYAFLCVHAPDGRERVESIESGLVYDAASRGVRGSFDCSTSR